MGIEKPLERRFSYFKQTNSKKPKENSITLLDIIRGLHLFTAFKEEHYTGVSGWSEELSLELLLYFFVVKRLQLQQYTITMSENWDIH